MHTSRSVRYLSSVVQPGLGSVYTGVVWRVVSPARTLTQALGYAGTSLGEPVRDTTPFDLASLTKIFTSAAVLRLIADHRLRLDDPIVSRLTHFSGAGKEQVQVRHLLTHTGGLPAFVRFGSYDGAPVDPWRLVLEIPLEAIPGSRVLYSDVGFMVLGKLIEEIVGMPLPQAIEDLVSHPLGLGSVRFGPCPSAPTTEYDSAAGRRIQGVVHDETARALGGAAGHAGLFGNAEDVAGLARAFVDPGYGFLPADLARLATSDLAATGAERRGLGWKLRSSRADAPESALSARSFGHYGFTGTAVWHDPERLLTAVLLTNRVYFGRDPEGIYGIRRAYFRAAVDLFGPAEDHGAQVAPPPGGDHR